MCKPRVNKVKCPKCQIYMVEPKGAGSYDVIKCSNCTCKFTKRKLYFDIPTGIIASPFVIVGGVILLVSLPFILGYYSVKDRKERLCY